MDLKPELSLSIDHKLHVRGFVINAVDGMAGIARPSLDAPDPESTDPRFQPNLVQTSKSPPWLIDEVTGTDGNGAMFRYNKKNLPLLGSFIDKLQSRDMSLRFVATNAKLRVGDTPP
jgi:hypothetical protein